MSALFLFIGVATACLSQSPLPNDVGTSRFGVLQQDMQFEFDGAWIRPHPGPFIWGWVERMAGHYDWRETDSTVEKLQGMRLAILATIWPFAHWDQMACHANQPRAEGAFGEFGNLLYMPCDLNAYASWVSALVERYDGDGIDDMPDLQYPIKHWEVSNEPEMQGPDLCFFQEPPERYVELLSVTRMAIGRADPSAVVVLGGQAGMHPEAVDYWRPILQDERTAYDIANIHSINCSDVQQDAAFWAPEYVAFLEENGRSSDPFWITESATGSMDPRHKLANVIDADDRNAQSRFIGTVVAFAEGAERIFHCVAFDPRGKKPQQEVGVFNLLGSVIGGFVEAARIAPSAVRFSQPSGTFVYALWDGARMPQSETGLFTVTTCLGETSVQDARSIRADRPVLVQRVDP